MDDPTESLGTNSRLKRYEHLQDMIGDVDNPTPIVRLNSVVPDGGAELYVKLEWMNPFGSLKDRPAKWMLEALEAAGELEGKTIIEATSGNTGIALASMAALMGYPIVTTVPHSMPIEKEVLLRIVGAKTVATSAEDALTRHPMDLAMDLALEMMANDPTLIMPNQYDNPINVQSHYESTGPEIWAQTEGRIRYFFAGFGTCGTITGVGRFLKEQDPTIKVIAIEPVPGHKISGLKNLEETSTPKILDRSVIDEVVYVNDAETREATLRLHREDALFAASSACAVIAGALKYLHGKEGLAVAVAPDSSMKAISYLQAALGL